MSDHCCLLYRDPGQEDRPLRSGEPPKWVVEYDGSVIVDRSRDPEHDACRALLARGVIGTVTFVHRSTAAETTRTDESIDLECALYDLSQMADIADVLLVKIFGESHEQITGHADLFYLSSRERERITFAVLQTNVMARKIVKAFEDGRLSA